MPKGKWADRDPAKRRAAAIKSAAARKANAEARRRIADGAPLMTRAEIAALRGTQADRVMPVESIADILARVRGGVPREASAERETARVPRETAGTP